MSGNRRPSGMGARRAIATLVALAALGCSEKPLPGTLVWESVPNLPRRMAYLNAVVAHSIDRVTVIGNGPPKGAPANLPLSLEKSGGTWTFVELPLPSNGWSAALLDAVKAADGAVWACGRTYDYEPEPSRIEPLIYRQVSGVWSQSEIEHAGDVEGVILTGIASARNGTDPEVRAVGDRRARGIALRWLGGRWTRDSVPAPATFGKGWWLGEVAQGRDGTWYAGGSTASGAGLLYADDGGGWKLRSRFEGYANLQISAVDFDTEGQLWMAGNYTFGDSLEGALFRLRGGAMERVPVARITPGVHTIQDIAFDAEGHGWLVGGRSGYLPFVAGSTGGPWREVIAEVEQEGPGAGETAGGELFGVDVAGETFAVAAGHKAIPGDEGFVEVEPGVYQLTVRPLGEIDAKAPPTGQRRVEARRSGPPSRILGPR